jgi:hypothetical protein
MAVTPGSAFRFASRRFDPVRISAKTTKEVKRGILADDPGAREGLVGAGKLGVRGEIAHQDRGHALIAQVLQEAAEAVAAESAAAGPSRDARRGGSEGRRVVPAARRGSR